MSPFWIVVGDARGPSPSPYRHPTQQSAIDEAMRLTRLNGGAFFVMEAQIVAQRNDVTLKRLSDDSDIPF